MNEFLRRNKQLFTERLKILSSNKIHFILGNISCDLDSCISAIVLSWIKHQMQDECITLYVPVMNINQCEFSRRTEISFIFNQLKISSQNLIFRDDFKFQHFMKNENFALTLVDHHELSSADKELYKYVVEIFDHRKKAREIDISVNVNMACVGSCCTLIAEVLLNSHLAAVPEEIKTMLLGTVLLDTDNLSVKSGKATARDIDVVNTLSTNQNDRDLLYQQLEMAKFSVDHLNTKDVLLKDLKFVEHGLLSFTFSSIHQQALQFLLRKDIESSIVSLCNKSMVLGWLGLFPIMENKDGEFKPIIVWSSMESNKKKLIEELLSDADLNIQYFDLNLPSDQFKCLRMKNVQRTRKQVLPVVRRCIERMDKQ